MPVLKGIITIEYFLYKILSKIPTKEEKLDFCKTLKTIFFFMKFDIRGFIKTLTTLFIALKLFKFRKKQTQTSYLKNIRIFFVKNIFGGG